MCSGTPKKQALCAIVQQHASQKSAALVGALCLLAGRQPSQRKQQPHAFPHPHSTEGRPHRTQYTCPSLHTFSRGSLDRLVPRTTVCDDPSPLRVLKLRSTPLLSISLVSPWTLPSWAGSEIAGTRVTYGRGDTQERHAARGGLTHAKRAALYCSKYAGFCSSNRSHTAHQTRVCQTQV